MLSRLFAITLLSPIARATVVVNEVATSGNANDLCNDEDYVELFATSTTTLTGLVLSDDHVRATLANALV